MSPQGPLLDFELRQLEPRDETALRAAVREFESADPEWNFAFDFDEGTDFAEYVQRLDRQRRGLDLPTGWIPSTYLVAIVENAIVGRISLRHELNEFLLNFGGHIGYGVVPSFRRRGYATQMLRRSLPIARSLGLENILVTCDEDNEPSRKIIERCGGQLDDIRPPPPPDPPKRRYWIKLLDSH